MEPRDPRPSPAESLLAYLTADGWNRQLAVGSHGAGAASPTVQSIVAEAADDVLGAFLTNASGQVGARFVPAAHSADCDGDPGCVALGPVLGLADHLAGHLHRLRQPGERVLGDRVPAQAPGPADSLPAAAALIAAVVTRDLLEVGLAHARHDNEHLHLALDSNRTIGVAMGVLMATRQVDREAAFTMLRTASQHQNRPIREIAADVEYLGAIPDR